MVALSGCWGRPSEDEVQGVTEASLGGVREGGK